ILNPEFRILSNFIDPGQLKRLQDLLAAVLRIVIETIELVHPAEKIGKADRQGIDVRMLLGQSDRNVAGVGPFHQCLASETMLMVYFGISITRSPSCTRA